MLFSGNLDISVALPLTDGSVLADGSTTGVPLWLGPTGETYGLGYVVQQFAA